MRAQFTPPHPALVLVLLALSTLSALPSHALADLTVVPQEEPVEKAMAAANTKRCQISWNPKRSA